MVPYLYLWGGWPKLPSVEANPERPNMQLPIHQNSLFRGFFRVVMHSAHQRFFANFTYKLMFAILRYVTNLPIDSLFAVETKRRVDSEFRHHPGAIESIVQHPADADQVLSSFY